MALYHHIPHPHLKRRAEQGPVTVDSVRQRDSVATRFNTHAAVIVTRAVGTMWCAYIFAAIAIYGLPAALKPGGEGLVSWVAQTFLQLVLLSIIIVGGNVVAAVTDKMNKRQFDDVEALLHGQNEQAAHSAAQDEKIIAIEEKILGIVTALQENTVITTEVRNAVVAAAAARTPATAATAAITIPQTDGKT